MNKSNSKYDIMRGIIMDTDKMPYDEIVARIKNPNQKVATTMGYLFEWQKEIEERVRQRIIKEIKHQKEGINLEAVKEYDKKMKGGIYPFEWTCGTVAGIDESISVVKAVKL